MTTLNQSNSSSDYACKEVVTAFRQAGQMWDHSLGSVVVKTAKWRFICIIILIINLLLSSYLLVLVHQPRHKVWAVATLDNGFVVGVGLLKPTSLQSKRTKMSSESHKNEK